jgi:hypothetical protein
MISSVLRNIRAAFKQTLKHYFLAAADYFNRDYVVRTWTCMMNKAV